MEFLSYHAFSHAISADRRSATDSFNANESAKHASFIQYVLCHISRLCRYGPCGGCGQHHWNWLSTMIRRVPWHASSSGRSRTHCSVEPYTSNTRIYREWTHPSSPRYGPQTHTAIHFISWFSLSTLYIYYSNILEIFQISFNIWCAERDSNSHDLTASGF